MSIKNTSQKVGEEYFNNPFWNREVPPDYQQELVGELRQINLDYEWDQEVMHSRADDVLLDALKYLGWEDLVKQYKDMQSSFWYG